MESGQNKELSELSNQSEVDAEEARSRKILKFLFSNWHELSGKVWIWHVYMCTCVYVCADSFIAEMVDKTKVNPLQLSNYYSGFCT